MFCYMCGAKIPDDAEFCTSCGTKNDVIKMSFGNGQYEKKNNSTPGKVIILRYNSYTKEFRYLKRCLFKYIYFLAP